MKSQNFNKDKRLVKEQLEKRGFDFKLKIFLETNRGFLEKRGRFFSDEDWEKQMKLYDRMVLEYRNHPVYYVIKKSPNMVHHKKVK
ncbi:hypothetical protein [Aquirufa sp. TARAVU-A1A]|jgi:hypothetical protein